MIDLFELRKVDSRYDDWKYPWVVYPIFIAALLLLIICLVGMFWGLILLITGLVK